MKQKHLVVYDYGQGGLWAFIYADSPQQIVDRYPELKVISETPAWMTDELRSRLEATETYDLDAPPSGLLADLLKERARGG
jgi:hypothetical protein